MKTILWAILGFSSLAIVSCAGSKSQAAPQFEEIAKLPDREEGPMPLKRHNRW